MFNSKIGIGVLKHPGYNGKGGGGSSQSTSTPVDFFGKDIRAPYEAELSNLLLGSYNYDQLKARPDFNFQFNQGLEALQRNFRSRGVSTSGNENLALLNYGNAFAGNYLQQKIANLVSASGAGLVANSTQSTSTQGQTGGILGDIVGAGTAFGLSKIFPSDKILKTNIKHINTINGIKIYSFNYVWSKIKSIGVMAQDLLEMPEYKDAVHMTNIGYVVDYSKLPI